MTEALKEVLCCFDLHVLANKQIKGWNVYDMQRKRCFVFSVVQNPVLPEWMCISVKQHLHLQCKHFVD